ncbi:hypothetical protein HK097_002474, partial [Rhizophlyctis rosea]
AEQLMNIAWQCWDYDIKASEIIAVLLPHVDEPSALYRWLFANLRSVSWSEQGKFAILAYLLKSNHASDVCGMVASENGILNGLLPLVRQKRLPPDVRCLFATIVAGLLNRDEEVIPISWFDQWVMPLIDNNEAWGDLACVNLLVDRIVAAHPSVPKEAMRYLSQQSKVHSGETRDRMFQLSISVLRACAGTAKKGCCYDVLLGHSDLVTVALDHISPATQSSALRISQHEAYSTTFVDTALKHVLSRSLFPANEIRNDSLMQAVRQTITRDKKANRSDFSIWLLRTLLQNLTPYLPYPTLDLTLSLFSLIQDTDPRAVEECGKNLYEAVATLVWECPFELVRQAASSLALSLVRSGRVGRGGEVGFYTEKGIELSKSTQTLSRLRGASLWGFVASLASLQADNSANIFSDLVKNLSHICQPAKVDLPSHSAEMHGTVEAISSVYHSSPSSQPLDSTILTSLIDSLFTILGISKEYLQQVQHFEDTGAEGDDDGDTDGGEDTGMGPSGIIACCWRSLKTGAGLLLEVVSRRKYEGRTRDFVRLGEVLMETVTTVRHWGLANGVQQTFMSLCAVLLESKDEEVRGLPGEWMKKALDSLDQMDVTRQDERYAGVPRILLGILHATPQYHRPVLVSEIMDKILSILGGGGDTEARVREARK